ncbi:MAG: LLM class flavin-dependent oxidoreductase [Candidatus Limnocylindrales bacterium]|jgi:alkanesulfonate monooxygenase SsuD/methylene tetrahydromethanopterin reductase-like flavin-dependent oxidoreductase (luciferase family)
MSIRSKTASIDEVTRFSPWRYVEKSGFLGIVTPACCSELQVGLRDFVFEPLPVQGARLPVLVGGRAAGALRHAGALGDGYHSTGTGPSEYQERLPAIRAAAEAAGRPMPRLSARLTVRFDAPASGSAVLAGDPPAMLAQVRAFAAIGVEELAIGFEPRLPDTFVAAVERFDREVVQPAVRA